MGTLVLVRHGQACPFEENGDRLSPTGELQALRLHEHWTRRGVTFDEVLSGTLVRQRRTAEIATGRAPEERSEFNEYDADGILGRLGPALADWDTAFAGLWADRTKGNREFQRMFEVLIPKWMDGTLSGQGVEPWNGFRGRVQRALRQIQRQSGSGRRIAVFASGGVIGTVTAIALGAPDSTAVAVNWRVKNCSMSEFTFSNSRLSLDSFNGIPHLDDPALVTFR
jgi:broad specificity phosphatase PhoE